MTAFMNSKSTKTFYCHRLRVSVRWREDAQRYLVIASEAPHGGATFQATAEVPGHTVRGRREAALRGLLLLAADPDPIVSTFARSYGRLSGGWAPLDVSKGEARIEDEQAGLAERALLKKERAHRIAASRAKRAKVKI